MAYYNNELILEWEAVWQKQPPPLLLLFDSLQLASIVVRVRALPPLLFPIPMLALKRVKLVEVFITYLFYQELD